MKRVLTVLGSIVLGGVPAFALQPPGGQDQFVPVTQVPASDQLPAAPLVIVAYAFVWLALMGYLWSVWRRLNKVEADMQTLDRRLSQRGGER